jgi:hypothetical protein
MAISIEVPVFKGGFLRPCIDSVLAQTSDAWTLSLVWDGGDRQSREILESLDREAHPRIRVHYTQNQGIARARKFLTDRCDQPYLLPLDDDDILPPQAVERFIAFAAERPWASLIRARRAFIDTAGALVDKEPWFPFAPRSYWRGMVSDLFNQAQPYLIRKSAYDRTLGWRGYADFMGAGEDCDIFLQLEETAHFELLDEVLYHYRLHDTRASEDLTPAAAFEMWRRLADDTLARIGLPLERAGDMPPFAYRETPSPEATLDDIDFVVRDDRAVDGLRESGVAEDAILRAAGDDWRTSGARDARRRLTCFLDEGVEVTGRAALEGLVETMNRESADLLVPRFPQRDTPLDHPDADDGLERFPPTFGKIILVRREVVRATGGFDDEWTGPALRAADFWIQARRRDFRCVEAEVAGFVIAGAPEWGRDPADVAMLRSKWRGYAELLTR